jgi:hypothetical protein
MPLSKSKVMAYIYIYIYIRAYGTWMAINSKTLKGFRKNNWNNGNGIRLLVM